MTIMKILVADDPVTERLVTGALLGKIAVSG